MKSNVVDSQLRTEIEELSTSIKELVEIVRERQKAKKKFDELQPHTVTAYQKKQEYETIYGKKSLSAERSGRKERTDFDVIFGCR